jgi:hypothetical protein
MRFPLLISLILLGGCAVQGPPFERAETPPGNATIYVYRPYNYGGSLLRPAVTCGDDTARIGPGGYHAFIVPARQPIICHVAQETTDEVEFDGEPRVYYVREEIGWGLLSGHPHLNPIDNDKAQAEIAQCCVKQDSVDTSSEPQP